MTRHYMNQAAKAVRASFVLGIIIALCFIGSRACSSAMEYSDARCQQQSEILGESVCG